MKIRHDDTIRIGCAGWNLPKAHADAFPPEGSHLERYAGVFDSVEINSSFYRSHRAQTYARWAASVPPAFRFAVKLPRTITHAHRLGGSADLLDGFFDEVIGLQSKLGCVLVQLPPGLAFDAATAEAFFAALRTRYAGAVALEPRHATWFEASVEALLRRYAVAQVAADPARVPQAAQPGGDRALVYFRLHGSPRMYYSAYDDERLRTYAQHLRDAAAGGAAAWCIFDNTALGAATANALTMRGFVRSETRRGKKTSRASTV